LRPETAIRLCLVIRCDLEGERLAVPERRAAVESETGTAEDGELHCYDIAGCGCRLEADRADQGKDDHPHSSVRTRRLPNAHEGAIHAPKESLYVEHDYADRFLSHA